MIQFQMWAALLNYVMILIQFRSNDKAKLAEQLALLNVTTTPFPLPWG